MILSGLFIWAIRAGHPTVAVLLFARWAFVAFIRPKLREAVIQFAAGLGDP